LQYNAGNHTLFAKTPMVGILFDYYLGWTLSSGKTANWDFTEQVSIQTFS